MPVKNIIYVQIVIWIFIYIYIYWNIMICWDCPNPGQNMTRQDETAPRHEGVSWFWKVLLIISWQSTTFTCPSYVVAWANLGGDKWPSFADDIFKFVFMFENGVICFKISPMLVRFYLSTNQSSLIQKIAWPEQALSRCVKQWLFCSWTSCSRW